MIRDDFESPDAATPADLDAPPMPPLRSGSPRARRSRRRVYVAGAIVLVAIGFLIFKGVTSAFVYFKTAEQAVADRSSLGNSTFQIEGTVVAGSRHGTADPSVFSFDISSGKTRVHVDNTGAPPQLFAPGIPVVLVGHFEGGSDRFASDQILVKHSNQYKAAHPNRVRSNSGVVH
ncbi:MAG TPA: cytochrome c maturation protein CcmE [Acidimicrobiales bacterium]|nr:cytochrome c maturation protein CcmE [Acidimicrobiales bacterium]